MLRHGFGNGQLRHGLLKNPAIPSKQGQNRTPCANPGPKIQTRAKTRLTAAFRGQKIQVGTFGLPSALVGLGWRRGCCSRCLHARTRREPPPSGARVASRRLRARALCSRSYGNLIPKFLNSNPVGRTGGSFVEGSFNWSRDSGRESFEGDRAISNKRILRLVERPNIRGIPNYCLAGSSYVNIP